MFALPTEDLEDVFLRLSQFWPVNKTFLITGGTGFFGRWLVESIKFMEQKLNSGNRFIILSRRQKSELIETIPVLKSNCFVLLNQDIQEEFHIDDELDYVIHAASEVSALKNSITSDFTGTVKATDNVIQAVNLSPKAKFLYVSSGAVYAQTADGSKEMDPLLPITVKFDTYGQAKCGSEFLVRSLSDFCIARCFSFVGPFADPKMAIMDMLDKKIVGQPIIVISPDVVRSYMYPTDLIVSLFKLLLLKNKYSEYNIGSDSPVRLGDLATKISRLNNISEVKAVDSKSGAGLAGNCYFPNTGRFNSEFGNSVSINLNKALEKTYNFLIQRKIA